MCSYESELRPDISNSTHVHLNSTWQPKQYTISATNQS